MQAQKEQDKTQEMRLEIDTIVKGIWFIQDHGTYEFSFIPKGCECGGIAGQGHGFPTYEIAVWEALKAAKQITAQGFHYHGGSKKYKNKKN
jgi:hypothetical protein